MKDNKVSFKYNIIYFPTKDHQRQFIDSNRQLNRIFNFFILLLCDFISFLVCDVLFVLLIIRGFYVMLKEYLCSLVKVKENGVLPCSKR